MSTTSIANNTTFAKLNSSTPIFDIIILSSNADILLQMKKSLITIFWKIINQLRWLGHIHRLEEGIVWGTYKAITSGRNGRTRKKWNTEVKHSRKLKTNVIRIKSAQGRDING